MLNKNIPKYIIDLESKLRSEKMYEQFQSLPKPNIQHSSNNNINNSNGMYDNNPTIKDKLYSEAINLIKLLLLLPSPFLIQSELYKIVAIKSCSKLTKIKNLLINKVFIKEHKLQKGKTKISIWEPTEKSYKTCKIEKRSYPRKA